VDKPRHDTMAFTALPRYSSAMIAWTNIEERHAVKITRHPVLHFLAALRGERASVAAKGRQIETEAARIRYVV